MPKRVEGSVCIVTGAAQGIGATYAKSLAGEGAKVVVSDVDDASAVADEIRASGGDALALRSDVADWGFLPGNGGKNGGGVWASRCADQ